MTIRPLPDFLKSGDRELGFPHPSPARRIRAIIGTATPDLPPVPPITTHDPPSARDRAGLEWVWHVMEGRIGER
jgi:hypothetical protein